jgi:hypothetical protein
LTKTREADEGRSILEGWFMFAKQVGAAVSVIVLLCSGCRSTVSHGYKDDPQLTPLMNAAKHDDLSRVRELLTHGADEQARTAQGATALYEAIERPDPTADNLPVVSALLDAGADPKSADCFPHTGLRQPFSDVAFATGRCSRSY